MLEVFLFTLLTTASLVVSRGSLARARSHGFYRFFAWELLALLLALNLRFWFVDPFSAHQLAAWVLLVVSGGLVLAGVVQLKQQGKPSEARLEPGLVAFEKTTVLVTDGIYGYIRHPLYASLLFLGWGIFFKQPSWVGLLLALGASAFLALTARAEEGENTRHFGDAYQAYMQHTKMFIPFVW